MAVHEWHEGRISHVASAWVSNVDKHTVEGEEAIRLCNYIDVYRNSFISDDMSFMGASATIDQIRSFALNAGDTLITKDSESSDDIGIPAFVHSAGRDLVCGYHLAIVRPRKGTDPRFLYWALCSSTMMSQWAILASGVTRMGLKGGDIRRARLCIPTPAEQRAIADYLDRETAQIDALIEKQEQLVATLRERRAATIAEGFNRWPALKTTPLKRVAAVQTGVTIGGESSRGDLIEVPYLRVANVQIGRVDLKEVKRLSLPLADLVAYRLRPGDVLMTEGGDVDKLGRGCLWRGDIEVCVHQNHVFAVRTGPHLDSRYLIHYLDSPGARLYFRQTAKKTTNLASTNRWTLGNLPLPLPPRADQVALAHELDLRAQEIDDLIERVEHFIDLSKERRAALITAAVTGQIDVRSAA